MRLEKATLNVDGTDMPVCRVNWGALDLQRTDGADKDPTIAHFQVETYRLLLRPVEGKDESTIYHVNDIFANMDESSQREATNFYIDAHLMMRQVFRKPKFTALEVDKLTKDISDRLYVMVMKTHLRDRLRSYILESGEISLPDLSNVGQRTQDDDKLTFREEEYIALTELVLLCKMLAPIWGELIYYSKTVVDINSKETQCCSVLHNIFSLYQNLTDKLFNYIMHMLREDKDNEATAVLNGVTENKMTLFVFGTMFVKKFVNIDLMRPGCNIMTYVKICTEDTTRTRFSNMRKLNRAGLRMQKSDDEADTGNTSALEEMSTPSRVSADIPILVEHAIERAVQQALLELHISQSDWESVCKYYDMYPVERTSFNRMLLATFFGSRIGGAGGINMVGAKIYNQMIAVVQLHMSGLGFTDLTHLLSIKTTDVPQPGTVSKVNSLIRFNATSSDEYRNCKNLFSYKIGSLQWDTSLKEIMDMITLYINYYNTAPIIWDHLDLDPFNGEPIIYGEHLVRHICAYILTIVRTVLTVKSDVE